MLALMWLQERQRELLSPEQILQVGGMVPHSNSGTEGSSSTGKYLFACEP